MDFPVAAPRRQEGAGVSGMREMSERHSSGHATSVAWVVLCESVARDETGRLSLFGIASHLPVPSLPLLLMEHRVVARLAHLDARQAIDVSFGIVTPGGHWIAPGDDAATLEVSGEFIIITLRSLPLREEGIHRLEVGLGNGSAASAEILVWLCDPLNDRVHVH